MDTFHRPVMVREVIASLRCRAGTTTVDGTVGGGGHAEAILENTAPDGILVGIDADADALGAAMKRLARFGKRAILMKGNFADMETMLAEQKIGKVDGILLDLGVSSHQLDTAERGFSFAQDAPLDMRMDKGRAASASDLVNALPSGLGQIDVPFFVGNPDLVTHTLTIDPMVFGLDPFWQPSFFINPGDPPPDVLGPGQSIMLHLGFTGGGIEGATAPTAPLDLYGDAHRVEVRILLDGVQVGGFTVELASSVNFLPVIAR